MAYDSTARPTHHRCDAKRTNGKPCKGISWLAVWCFQFQDWNSDRTARNGQPYSTGPSWWDVCNTHQHIPQRQVSSMGYPKRS
jgi:hypothetical protein